MQRLLSYLVVLAAGIAIGYFVACLEPAPELTTPAVDPTDDDPDRHGAAVPLLQGVSASDPAAPKAPIAAPRVAPNGRVEVSVQVVMPNGDVPENARIYWHEDENAKPGSMHHMNWKPANSSIYAKPGDAWIHATSGTQERLKSKRLPIQVSSKPPRQEVRLVLSGRAGIYGSVVLPGEFDRPRLRVQLLAYDGDTPPEQPKFDRSVPSVSPRERDGYGFAFHDLAPGGYLLGLSLGREGIVAIEDVRVGESMIQKDLVIEAFDPKHFMEVTVLDPKGVPMRDAQLSIFFSGKGTSIAGGNISLRRKDGVFIVDHAPGHTRNDDGTYKDGVFTLHVRTQEHGEIVKPYRPGSKSLTIRVGELQDLAIQLVGYADAAVPHDLLAAVRMVGETGVTNPKPIAPDGSVNFGARPPGTYEIVLLTMGQRSAIASVLPIVFAPGDAIKEIPTPVFHRLIVQLPKNAVDPVFRLSRKYGTATWSYQKSPSEDPDQIVFLSLTAGTYKLEGHVGDRWIKREIRLPENAVIRID